MPSCYTSRHPAMLRIGRSKLHSKWPSTELDVESASNEDLEGASMPQTVHHSSRSKLSIFYPRSTLSKAILCIAVLSVMAFILPRPRVRIDVGGKDQMQWTTRQDQTKYHAASQVLANISSRIPAGNPLQASSLSNPPRIDSSKLLARLVKLETKFPDDGVDEDTDAIADDLRQAYGLSRWPPLISRVPSVSGRQHEEYSVETSDVLFCSTVPCKVLLPVWARPLSPTQQIIQMQQLIYVAKHLNRTLVLPNTGHTSNDTGEVLLGVGTCHRHPFARYFDASRLLLTSSGKTTDHSPVVPMQPFLEWVKYRPVHPSAQVVVIDSSPSFETHDLFFAMGAAEIRIDEHAERGRGRHKFCLSSRASKLKFGTRPTFVVSPARDSEEAISSATKLNLEVDEDVRMKATSRYFDGVLAFLAGETRSSDEALCREAGSGSCPTSRLPLDVGNPDVLVVEWGLGPVGDFDFSSAIANEDNALLDYSPRLHVLASRTLATLVRPLIMLRQNSSMRVNSSDPSAFVTQVDTSNLAKEIDDFLQGRRLVPEHVDVVSEEAADVGSGDPDASVRADDLEGNATETTEKTDSAHKMGTIWLKRGLSLEGQQAQSMLAAEGTEVDREGACKPAEDDLTCSTSLSSDMLNDYSLVDISSVFSRNKSRSSRGLVGLGRLGILEDVMIQAILEEIIEGHADRVLSV